MMKKSQLSRQTKECTGCGEEFITFKNYDYCSGCAINDQRYRPDSNCPECDSSGMIKFPQQQPRACKLCTLNAVEQQFWQQVDQQAQSLIINCLQQVLPLQPSALQLNRDADYQKLLKQELPQYHQESDPAQLAQTLTTEYLLLVQSALNQLLTNYDN